MVQNGDDFPILFYKTFEGIPFNMSTTCSTLKSKLIILIIIKMCYYGR